MSYAFYKVLHFVGLFLLFSSLGGVITHTMNGGSREDNPSRGLLAASHGVGLLLVFVAGFGMHAKRGIEGMPAWFLAKIAIWLVLGALITVAYRMPQYGRPLWFAVPVLGSVAAWLAVTHG